MVSWPKIPVSQKQFWSFPLRPPKSMTPTFVCRVIFKIRPGPALLVKYFWVYKFWFPFLTVENIVDVLGRMVQCTNSTFVGLQCDGKCISINQYRDCQPKCADGADQACLPGFVKCDGCKCVAPSDVGTQCLGNKRKSQSSRNNYFWVKIFSQQNLFVGSSRFQNAIYL